MSSLTSGVGCYKTVANSAKRKVETSDIIEKMKMSALSDRSKFA